MLNPNYIQGIEPNPISTGEFFKSYSDYIEKGTHETYKSILLEPQEFAIWPQFSLDKIRFLPGETLFDLLIGNAIILSIASGISVPIIYKLLASKKISLASPFFNNIRKKNAANFASCFIVEVDDSIESIMKSLTYCAKISQAGGGTGVSLGLIRGCGSPIRGVPNSSQSISVWVKLFDQICVAVNQLGQRPGAMTVSLPIWHSDIYDFLDVGTETGDLRCKSYNVQPQVVVSDCFMRAVVDNADWHLYSPDDLIRDSIDPRSSQDEWLRQAIALSNHRSTVKARHLWSKIQELQVTVGRPYLFFEDTVDRGSPFAAEFGMIKAGNLCQESYSYFKADQYIHTCSLGSVNVGECADLQEIHDSAYVLARLIDSCLDSNTLDIPEVDNHVTDFRTIGVGIMGLADYLARNNFSYAQVDKIEAVSKAVALGTYKSSLQMAEEFGACEASLLLVPSAVMLALEELEPELKDRRLVYGIRNAMMLCTAPNTSTSITMGACPSFLPPYDLSGWYEDNNDLASKVELKYMPEDYLLDIKTTPPDFILDAALAIQKWTDAGISAEFLLVKGKASSENAAFSLLKIDAWERGLKSFYYIRTSDAPKDGCSSCAN